MTYKKSIRNLRRAGLLGGDKTRTQGRRSATTSTKLSGTGRSRRRRVRGKRMAPNVHVVNDIAGTKSDLQRKIEFEGYVWNEEYGMAEHRAVAFKLLGRPLRTDEHVHHCNHVKKDNSPLNLFVLSPAIHDIVHIATIISPSMHKWPCGVALVDPPTLAKFLKDEGIPHIWLKEVADARNLGN